MSVIRLAVGCAAVACAVGFGLAHRPELLALARQSGLVVADATPLPADSEPPLSAPLASQASTAGVGPSGAFVALAPDRLGQYHTDFDVQGQRVEGLVDTGATTVALSYETAARLGLLPAPAEFTIPIRTANGLARAAAVDLPELHIGPLVARHVRAMVSERGALTTEALLGMSLLRRFGGVAIRDGRLILSQ